MKASAVHSQTLPIICRQPHGLSPAAWAATAAQPQRPAVQVGPFRRRRVLAPGEASLRAPAPDHDAAASHSASVGSRRPAQRQ